MIGLLKLREKLLSTMDSEEKNLFKICQDLLDATIYFNPVPKIKEEAEYKENVDEHLAMAASS